VSETTYYKWMLEGRLTGYQGKPWPTTLKRWTPNEEPFVCESGWHACEAKDLLSHLPHADTFELFIVKGRGNMVSGDDKVAFTSMQLVERVGVCDKKMLRLFGADCAERVLPIFLKVLPNDDRPAKAIQAARDFANGKIDDAAGLSARDAAWYAAQAAARAAAWDAAWDTAGYAAQAARVAAGAAAQAAAGDTGGYAAQAARVAAWDAAWDTAGYAAQAARVAAWDTAGAAAGAAARAAAWDAAWDTAGYAERQWQGEHLVDMIRSGQGREVSR
jgi:hypothetical protein